LLGPRRPLRALLARVFDFGGTEAGGDFDGFAALNSGPLIGGKRTLCNAAPVPDKIGAIVERIAVSCGSAISQPNHSVMMISRSGIKCADAAFRDFNDILLF